MFAVVTFVEKYRAYLGSAPFKLRVDNRALSWFNTYSMDHSYIGRWIVRLDGYHMIIVHRMRDKHQQKTQFYEKTRTETSQSGGNQGRILVSEHRNLRGASPDEMVDKSGHPIPGQHELPVEKAAEISFYQRRTRCLRICCYVRTWSNRNSLVFYINSLSLLDKTVRVTPQVMRMLGGL